MFYVHNPYMVLPIQMLHGVIVIVLLVTMAIFINEEVPNELKASGQTFNGLISLGVARILGSILGGVFSEYVGMRDVFLYNAIIAFITFLVFMLVFKRESKVLQTASI
ncbi:MFS transporter [Neobacillus pocheonensis]|uniref:MFS transporter n=1 Tax=Neobacillus pocheonensis TaxID=363869 RepID=UPI003D2C29EB